MEERVRRKLTTILAADVVGYTRLMRDDEAATVAALESCRAVLDELINRHGGRVFNTAGDSVLAEFGSAVEAVQCAKGIQEALADRNAGQPKASHLMFRIGVNVGDVIVKDEGLLGDGVNIAARLEGMAPPGGICISGSAFDLIRHKLSFDFEALGPQKVKNISEPIAVYRLADVPAGHTTASARLRPWVLLLLLAGAVIIAGTFAFRQPYAPGSATSNEKVGVSRSDRPSIAVLPFQNTSGDKEQEYFSDGITEDLITDLSKISGLMVIARNSTFAYKGRSMDVRRVAKELDVGHVLEGSVRKAGGKVRINAQLIDGESGTHVWAERYDGELKDVFSVQDRVTAKIVTVLAVKLTEGEQQLITRRYTRNEAAYDLFLKGWHNYQSQTPEGYDSAIKLFKEATQLDPAYSHAHAALAATYWQIWRRTWFAKIGGDQWSLHDPQFLAEAALEEALKDPTALALQTSASFHAQAGHHDRAIEEGERALALDPNDAEGFVALASALNLAGEFAKASVLVDRAIRLNPHYPGSYLYELGLAQFGLEQFDQAAATFEKAIAISPEDRWSQRVLLATYGHLGRGEDAATLFKLAEVNWRGFDPLSIRAILFWYPFRRTADTERLTAGLRAAKVPD